MALRQHLKQMPVGPSHHIANARHVVSRNLLVDQVAHRGHKDLARPTPMERLFELVRYQSEIKPMLEGVTRNAAESYGEGLGVTMLAARTDLRAAPNRIPSRVGALD